MAQTDPQVPWTDEQWARVQQVVQEEVSRARLAATFLPLVGPLAGGTDFVRKELIEYPPGKPSAPGYITIEDANIIQLATLQVKVSVRGAQMADREMASVLALFRRSANVLARLEDAIVFRGRPPPPSVVAGLPNIWEISGAGSLLGLWTAPLALGVTSPWAPPGRGERLVHMVSDAIGRLEGAGHFGPFAAVLGPDLFVVATTPSPAMVLPQDRIIPFLSGGPLHRSSTLASYQLMIPPWTIYPGLIVALGGAPVELVIGRDVSVQFLQLTPEPVFVFRVFERMALRIKEPEAIMRLFMYG